MENNRTSRIREIVKERYPNLIDRFKVLNPVFGGSVSGSFGAGQNASIVAGYSPIG